MKIKSASAPAIGRGKRSRPGLAAPLQGLVLTAGLVGAMAAGTAGTASAAVKAPAAPMLKASTAVTASNPPVGSYTATNPQDGQPDITFYVSSSKTSLQDISIPTVYLTCTPAGDANPAEPFGVASIPLQSNGSFTSTTTQTGVYSGYPAKFTYTFQGNYQGLSSSGVPTVTGTFKETLKFTDSAARTCTSGTQSWTATRDAQPRQTTTPPPVGSYTATNPQDGQPDITFYVSSSQTSLQDISIPVVYLDCAPGNAGPAEPLGIASAPLMPDGSFTVTTTQTGVYAGYPAKFTYTFQGNFHGAGPSGAARAAGTFRETMKFTDSAARTCTSNTRSWTAGRDTQPPQTTSLPPAGGYTATNPQDGQPDITFSVSSSRTHLQNVSIPVVYLDCAPGNAGPAEPFAIASIPLSSSLAFTATTTKTGVYAGHPAKFTYTFRGNFHGVAPSGAARAAGTFQETMTFTDSAARTCTSNLRSWTATRNP